VPRSSNEILIGSRSRPLLDIPRKIDKSSKPPLALLTDRRSVMTPRRALAYRKQFSRPPRAGNGQSRRNGTRARFRPKIAPGRNRRIPEGGRR